MSKEEKMPTEQEAKETVLDLEDAKEMTVGQAARKNEEVEAGVTSSNTEMKSRLENLKPKS